MMLDVDFYNDLDLLIEDLTPIPDMAIMLGIPVSEFRILIDDEESDVHDYFYKKLAAVKRKIRHRDIELAEANSPTAMEAVNHHLKRMIDSL